MALAAISNVCPFPQGHSSDATSGLSCLVLTMQLSPRLLQRFPGVQLGGEGSMAGMLRCLGSCRKLASVSCNFNSHSPPCSRRKQACVCSSRAKSRLPPALLLVSPALQLVKGIHLPGIGFQHWRAQYLAQITHSPGRIFAHVISLLF